MWRKLLYSGFHAHKAVTYHAPTVLWLFMIGHSVGRMDAPTVLWLFMIGHSVGRMETCFGPSTQGGAGIRYQNTSQIQILLAIHFDKKGRDVRV